MKKARERERREKTDKWESTQLQQMSEHCVPLIVQRLLHRMLPPPTSYKDIPICTQLHPHRHHEPNLYRPFSPIDENTRVSS